MTTDPRTLEHPIDAMYLLHRALRAEAARVEALAGGLEEGGSLQPFRQAFYLWVMALAYHADMEDAHMTSLLPDLPAARECELAHGRLAERLEDVQQCLTEEIGRTMLIARAQRHLFGAVVMARIAQDDHLEEEEAFVLPAVRRQLSDAQQWVIVRHLLLDEGADDPHWHLDWLADYLTTRDWRLLGELAARAKESCLDWPTELFTRPRD